MQQYVCARMIILLCVRALLRADCISPVTRSRVRMKQRVHVCLSQSAGLHDEINWIIAIVGLCSLSEQG